MIQDTTTPVCRDAESLSLSSPPAPCPSPLTSRPLPLSLGPMAFIGFLICSFAYVILKEAGFSRLLVMGAAVAGSLWCLSKGSLRREFVIYFLVAYLPFSKQIPVDFGGIFPGLNLTNILVGLAGLIWYREKGKDRHRLSLKVHDGKLVLELGVIDPLSLNHPCFLRDAWP